MTAVRNLIFVLGDQLSPGLSSLVAGDPDQDIVFMAEVQEEATYVRHHKKKIAFLFSAMRHFAAELEALGWRVDYVKLDAANNRGSFTAQLGDAVSRHGAEQVLVTEPGEWRVMELIKGWQAALGLPVRIQPDDRFVCSHAEFEGWAEGRKQLRMDSSAQFLMSIALFQTPRKNIA